MALQARDAFTKQNSDLFFCYKLLNIPLDIAYCWMGISTDFTTLGYSFTHITFMGGLLFCQQTWWY